MNELTLLNSNQIQSATNEQLKDELARSLKITSDYLVYMSLIWSELNKRGFDLSELKSGLFQYIPLIATNQLDARLVVEFAGNKTLLSALSRLEIHQQAQIADTKIVPFVYLNDDDTKVVTELDLTKAKATEIYQVFGGESGFRNADQQYVLLMNRQQAKNKTEKSHIKQRKTYSKVGFDKNNRYMMLGDDSKILLDTVFSRLSEHYNIDVKEILKRHTKAID